jgi:hypothetical protein
MMGAIADDEAGVRMGLTVCGASDGQQDAIILEGINEMNDLTVLDEKEVGDMITGITKLPTNRGGIQIGAIITKRVKALVYWAKEQKRRAADLDATRFDEDALENTLALMAHESIDNDTKPELPTAFDPNKWVLWAKKVKNYLWQVKGKNNTPLMYVIRKPRPPNAPAFISAAEEQINSTAQTWPAYIQDRQMVFQVLTQLLGSTQSWTWISKFEKNKDGKAAFESLRRHFDGPGEIKKRLAFAYNILNNTHYQSERQFSFENYVTKLSEAFEVLADNDTAKGEREKVDILLNGIHSAKRLLSQPKQRFV